MEVPRRVDIRQAGRMKTYKKNEIITAIVLLSEIKAVKYTTIQFISKTD